MLVLLASALAASATSNTSCATQSSAAACKSAGCAYCSWCPICAGQCYGDEGDGVFTCASVLSTYPDTAEYGYDCDPFNTDPGMCVKVLCLT